MIMTLHASLIENSSDDQINSQTKVNLRLKNGILIHAHIHMHLFSHPIFPVILTMAEFKSESNASENIVLLFLICCPVNQPTIDVMLEARKVKDRIDMGNNRFTAIIETAVSIDDIPRLLNKHRPHILHFSGHGGSNGPVVVGKDGLDNTLSVNQLMNFLRSQRDRIRLIYVNACYSQAYAMDLGKLIDFVIVNEGPVDDTNAINFAVAFYGALSFERTVTEAYNQGVAIIADSQCVTKYFIRVGANQTPLMLFEGNHAPRYNEDVILSRIKTMMSLGGKIRVEWFMQQIGCFTWNYANSHYYHTTESNGEVEVALSSDTFNAVMTVSQATNMDGRKALCDAVELQFGSRARRVGDDTGRNFLHYATMNNCLPLLHLFQGQADFNSIRDKGDSDYKTPLHLAVTCGYVGMIAALLAAGADTSRKDLKDLTALDTALLSGRVDVIFLFRHTFEFKILLDKFAAVPSLVDPAMYEMVV
jgi:hypothetical protein